MIFHRQSHDVIILPNNGQIYQLWNCLLVLSQAPKFFSIFQSSITALWYGSLVKKNNKGHVNGRHKALFLSQFPWSFVSKHEHCFWLGVSPLYPRQLSVTAALSEPLVLSCLVFHRKMAPMKESLCSTPARRTTWILARSTRGTAWGEDRSFSQWNTSHHMVSRVSYRIIFTLLQNLYCKVQRRRPLLPGLR